MERANAARAILAGFIATLVMTIMAYAAPMMGLPKMDFAAMLGAIFSGQMGGAWWMGMIMRFHRQYTNLPTRLCLSALPGAPRQADAKRVIVEAHPLAPVTGCGNAYNGTGILLCQSASADVDSNGKLDWAHNLWSFAGRNSRAPGCAPATTRTSESRAVRLLL